MSNKPLFSYPLYTPDELHVIRRRAQAERAKVIGDLVRSLFRRRKPAREKHREPAMLGHGLSRC
jgi:hypothetical protein